ncbi:SDR family NAD(P)-dependent oxidoreductase [Dyadobacter sp. CY312]|uniref:SDR family NAD(P)-dependent oxidoreductase n=1 Tax=Dyadobacter sp. CY312 TaxID=2907303 RepID=UPI001F210D58|nr:SDR family NAD(P)-dependent oxidoreductase [Dyadobacter sp. CY312]MCE7039090.1 SDR family NAD(P)-dependent oxidoreductase [Dyadobacter sp. CY312]
MSIHQITASPVVNILGLLVLLRITYLLLNFVYTYIRPSSILKYKTDGAYAVVTGASDGIGKAIALELAAKGFNLILHGRDPDKIDTVNREVLTINPLLDIRSFIHDSSVNHLSDISEIQQLPIKVLVNNVGIGPIKSFSQLSKAEIDATVNVNVLFPTHLTNCLLPFLSGPALVLNISSYAGIHPPPYLAVYAATKAYNNAFSKSLSVELDTIETISILTGSVHTGSNKKPVSFLRPSSRQFAKKVLSVVGCGKKSVMPYWPHAVQTYLLSLLPERMMDRAMKNAIRQELK